MTRSLAGAAILSALASLLLLGMLALAIYSGGVSQQKFEMLSPLTGYTAEFIAARPTMMPTLALDNLFIIAYVSALALGLGALVKPETRILGRIAIGGMVAVGLLDYAENLHFLTMYAALAAGGGLSFTEIGLQMWASLFKWHIAYLALFAASFVIRSEGLVSFSLVWSLRIVLPVIGVLVYTVPEAIQPAFLIARYALMLLGFLMFAAVFVSASRKPA